MGLKIYEGTDGWNGMRNDNTPAPVDTYFYTIYDENGKLIKRWFITLIRKQ
jgi:hypothetical protein